MDWGRTGASARFVIFACCCVAAARLKCLAVCHSGSSLYQHFAGKCTVTVCTKHRSVGGQTAAEPAGHAGACRRRRSARRTARRRRRPAAASCAARPGTMRATAPRSVAPEVCAEGRPAAGGRGWQRGRTRTAADAAFDLHAAAALLSQHSVTAATLLPGLQRALHVNRERARGTELGSSAGAQGAANACWSPTPLVVCMSTHTCAACHAVPRSLRSALQWGPWVRQLSIRERAALCASSSVACAAAGAPPASGPGPAASQGPDMRPPALGGMDAFDAPGGPGMGLGPGRPPAGPAPQGLDFRPGGYPIGGVAFSGGSGGGGGHGGLMGRGGGAGPMAGPMAGGLAGPLGGPMMMALRGGPGTPCMTAT